MITTRKTSFKGKPNKKQENHIFTFETLFGVYVTKEYSNAYDISSSLKWLYSQILQYLNSTNMTMMKNLPYQS